MTILYVLFHSRDDERGEQGKAVGVYSTEENAQAALARLRDQPGLLDDLDEFDIFEETLDHSTSWRDGFVTIWPGEY